MFRIILREMFRIRIKLYYVRLVLTKYSKAHNFENIQISFDILVSQKPICSLSHSDSLLLHLIVLASYSKR